MKHKRQARRNRGAGRPPNQTKRVWRYALLRMRSAYPISVSIPFATFSFSLNDLWESIVEWGRRLWAALAG